MGRKHVKFWTLAKEPPSADNTLDPSKPPGPAEEPMGGRQQQDGGLSSKRHQAGPHKIRLSPERRRPTAHHQGGGGGGGGQEAPVAAINVASPLQLVWTLHAGTRRARPEGEGGSPGGWPG